MVITPHGGRLVKRVATEPETLEQYRELGLPVVAVSYEREQEIRNIGFGVYSPLEGFMRRDDLERVLEEMRLTDGTLWPIPIVLDVSEAERRAIATAGQVFLVNSRHQPLAILESPEIYPYDKDKFSRGVFGTTDPEHPGVAAVGRMNDYLVGGEITLLDTAYSPFPSHGLVPEETRVAFSSSGWQSVVAFQTRNIPHRGHEFLQKEALKEADGLLVHPVLGWKKEGDFKDEYILSSYEILIQKHYPAERVKLSALSIPMRYAGPKEAVLHAIIRKNFGCSHFIVGRDHAGVGDYYGPFEAQEIFDTFAQEDLGVTILKYPEVVYDEAAGSHRFFSETGNGVSFSGTAMRRMIQNRERPPEYILRPEVYSFLINSDNIFVDSMYNDQQAKQQGFVLWFTGLSQSGKTTNALEVYNALKDNYRLEYLDGDVVREHLSRDLGFSKADRDENIKRVTFVAKLLSQNQTGVLCAFISPYRAQRERIREEVTNFVEVFCDSSLEHCEARDTKGLYQKARAGEIENFTGISDPYEIPENPEIVLDTVNNTPSENAEKIIAYLKDNDLIV